MLLTDLLTMTYSAHQRWALSHHSQIKKMFQRLAYSPDLWKHFSTKVPSMNMTHYSLCQVDIKLASIVPLSVYK